MDSNVERGRGANALSRIEIRSFDYVPSAERHGKVWHQGPFWFMAEAELLTLASGFVGGGLGLAFGWSMLAIVIGVLFGACFIVFHAMQGPRLGLPQMIQSRAQFGRRGAVIPSAMVVFLYVGFTVFDAILLAQIGVLFSITFTVAAVVVIVLAVAIAIVGHDLLHAIQRWLSYVVLLAFGVFTIGVIATHHAPAHPASGDFQLAPFLTQFGVTAAYVIGFAPYIADYTRYLPIEVKGRPIALWTYLGHAVGAIWFMGVGAFLIEQYPQLQPAKIIQTAGNGVFGGLGTLVLALSIPGLISIMAVNIYGTVTTGTAALDSFRRLNATATLRVLFCAVIGVILVVLTLFLPDNFLSGYSNFVTVLLYFLVPWTAINLIDFYVVRRGHYALLDLFRTDGGVYRRWSVAGVTAYFVSFACMIPFFSTTFFTGPIAKSALGGADISFAVGLPVAAAVYWVMTRGIDLPAERRLAAEQSAQAELGGIGQVAVAGGVDA